MVEDKPIDFTTLLQMTTETIALAFKRTERILASHSKIGCSVSGGADSDIMLDMLYRLDKDKKVEYYYIDTGLEMQATKDHIEFLKKKYGIEIKTIKPKVPIPLAVKKYGVPFMSKDVSRFVGTMQNHNFGFGENEKVKTIRARMWWNNESGGMFNVDTKPFLKEYMIDNPPNYAISEKCCFYAKKQPAHEIEKNYDLVCIGLRKGEGGVRASKKSCFEECGKGADKHYPVFWFLEADKKAYCNYFGVTHSRAYTEYGFKRTGCAGCPFNSKFDKDLEVLRKHEPKLAKAAENIFGDSYEYSRGYKKFRFDMKHKNQMRLFESEGEK